MSLVSYIDLDNFEITDEIHNIRKKGYDIDKELDKTYKDLYKWALSLEYINKKER